MAIEATTPTVLDAATFGLWAVASLRIEGDGLADFGGSVPQPVRVQATLVKYRLRGDGVPERSPFPGDILTLALADLYAAAAADPALAAAIPAILAAVLSIGQGRL